MIYTKLIELSEQLESMISDGVQLVHGGDIFDWNETVITELLEDINKQREFIESESINSRDTLINSITQEEVTVIKTDKINVYIEPINTPIKYPKNEIWKHYKLKEQA